MAVKATEVISIRGEVAAFSGGTWTLVRAPLAGVSVYCNGLRQTDRQPQDATLLQDFSLTGKVLTGPFWKPTDTILCDYECVV